MLGKSELVTLPFPSVSHPLNISLRPVYQEEESPQSEQIQIEDTEIINVQMEDHTLDEGPDSEEENPVFLDLTNLKTGKELEVCTCNIN